MFERIKCCGFCTDIDTKKNVILSISSDRGLCGGINSSVVKYSKCIKKLVDGMCPETLLIIENRMMIHRHMVIFKYAV